MSAKASTWRSGSTAAAEKLGTAIVHGRFAEDAQLPTEEALARQLGFGRNTVREAMRLLAAKSLVAIAPRRGTVVLPRHQWNLLDRDVLAWSGSLLERDPDFMRELMRMRRVLEPAAAEEAAQNANDDEIATIFEAFRAMARTAYGDDAPAKIEADLGFHRAVFVACHNRFIRSLAETVIHALRANFTMVARQTDSFERNLDNHRLLAEAIGDHDPLGARDAAERLLAQNRADTERGVLKFQGPPPSDGGARE